MLAILAAAGRAAPAHSRIGPDLSDVALFALACLGVWIVRRALRRRFRRD